jgi:hypothetical protein
MDQVVEGKDPMLSRVIEEAIRKVNYHEESIASGLDSLVRRAEQVKRNLDRGMNLNELGEFQSLPADIDRHIAQRSAAWQNLGLVLSNEEMEVLREGYDK